MRSLRVAALALLLTAACAGTGSPSPTPATGLAVASFNFDESRLLAEIYAQALEAHGLAVRRELDLGQRELVLPALRDGLVDIVPEYAGSALDAADPDAAAAASDTPAVIAALDRAVAPWGLVTLRPSDASNQNVLAVTRQRAEADDLARTSDLRRVGPLVLGGPPECVERPRCLPGLRERYGLDVTDFVPLAGADLVRRALADGVVDVGVLFSTDAALADDDVVELADDRGLQPADTVVPLVRSEVLGDGEVRATLDAVSARLTTRGLRFLNWRLQYAGTTITAEAHGWLVRHELVPR